MVLFFNINENIDQNNNNIIGYTGKNKERSEISLIETFNIISPAVPVDPAAPVAAPAAAVPVDPAAPVAAPAEVAVPVDPAATVAPAPAPAPAPAIKEDNELLEQLNELFNKIKKINYNELFNKIKTLNYNELKTEEIIVIIFAIIIIILLFNFINNRNPNYIPYHYPYSYPLHNRN